MDPAFQRCIDPDCAATRAVDDTSFVCDRCGTQAERTTKSSSLRAVGDI